MVKCPGYTGRLGGGGVKGLNCVAYYTVFGGLLPVPDHDGLLRQLGSIYIYMDKLPGVPPLISLVYLLKRLGF